MADVEVWFEDECHFEQHGSRCIMWVPPEVRDPVLAHAPTRRAVGVFGAVNARNGRLVTQTAPKFDASTFQVFLTQLVRHRPPARRMVVVLDNAGWHHAKALRPWLRKHRHTLRLDFLPTYSPELNHIERVWKLTRRLCIHNRYFAELDELTRTILGQFASWARPNNSLLQLCAIT